jgi:hypothetical protein
VGRRLLVGISYRNPEGVLLRQEQFCGPVLEVVDGVVVVDRPQEEGGPADLPADAQAYDPAPRGRYVLGITGDVVVDPDFVTTWDVVTEDGEEPQA